VLRPANVGYSFGPWSSSNPTTVGNTNCFNGTGFVNSASPSVNGVLGGGQVGYNWQQNNFVFGLEGDFQWSGEKTSNNGSLTTLGDDRFTIVQSSSSDWKLDWLATFRGRAGILIAPQWLLYGTGGLALGEAKYSNTTTASVTTTTLAGTPLPLLSRSVTVSSSEAKTRTGWTIGAGVETKIAKNWTAKLEYLYVDLGSYTYLAGTGLDTNVKLRDYIVRVGVNYLFN
jgi:outer membrane immunogenic protein